MTFEKQVHCQAKKNSESEKDEINESSFSRASLMLRHFDGLKK